MKITIPYSQTVLPIFAAILFFSSCKNANDDIPFPVDETGFAQPLSRPLQFGEWLPVKWSAVEADSGKSLPEKQFDYAKLPSRPFDIGDAFPISKPMEEQSFNWDSLPGTPFNIDQLPAQKLKFKTTLYPAPKIIKAGLPNFKQGLTRGVMEVGSAMGLPGNARCFLQDEHDLLWIGTDKGLCRYDGENVEIYGVDQGITDDNIFSVSKDSSNQIWAGTGDGNLFVLDRNAGLMKQLIDTFSGGNTTTSVIQDKRGQTWFNRLRGAVYIINSETQTLKKLDTSQGLSNIFNIKMLPDDKGRVWITTRNGVNVIDQAAGINKRITTSNGLSGDYIFSLLQDHEGKIWIGGNDGVSIVDLNNKKIKRLGNAQGLVSNNNIIAGLTEDKARNIWISNDSGIIYSYNQKTQLLQKFKVSTGAGNLLYNLFGDNQGQVWTGSIQVGSFVINTAFGRPGNFTKADGLGDNNVWSIVHDKQGRIFIGTYNGIDVYDPVTKTIKHIGKEQGLMDDRNTDLLVDSTGRVWANGNGSGISIIDMDKGRIRQIPTATLKVSVRIVGCKEEPSGMWMGTAGNEIVVYNAGIGVKKLMLGSNIANNRIENFQEDQKGRLWIATNLGGLYMMNKARDSIRHINGLISNQLTTLMEATDGSLWVGSQKGIDILNDQANTATSLTMREGIASTAVWTLNEWNGKFYAGSSSGLTIISRKADNGTQKWQWYITTIGRGQGLSYADFAQNSSMLYRNQLWAGVENSILTIIDEPKPDTTAAPAYITGISILDKPQEFTDRRLTEAALAKVDTLWKTEKDSFYAAKQLPIDTSYFTKNNIHWDSTAGPYHLPANLHLPYNQNYLSFSFSCTHISGADQVKYRYILQGIDKNWSPVSEKSYSENYRDLSPGHYTFKVAGMGLNGVWSKPAAFSFTITPPWWQTWWAWLLYTIIFIGLVAVYIRYRSRALMEQNQLLEEKVLNRTNELRKSLNDLRETQNQLIQSEKMASLGELTAGIAHEIQNPLNFVNNFSEVSVELADDLKAELEDTNLDPAKKSDIDSLIHDLVQNQQKINFHGKRADAIVKGMLQHSRSSNGLKDLTDINALADEYLRLSYHGLRAKDKSFNATMNTDFDEGLQKINIVSQDIGRVILNLITNAFYAVTERKKQRSAEDRYEPTVSVSTRKINYPAGHEGVEIRVKDNGPGVPQKVLDKIFQPFFTTKPVGEGTGLGLSLSYDIIKAHHGELLVETSEGNGAEFIIRLPIQHL